MKRSIETRDFHHKKNHAFLSLLKINNGFRIKIQITVYLLKYPPPGYHPTPRNHPNKSRPSISFKREQKIPTSVKIINIFMNS